MQNLIQDLVYSGVTLRCEIDYSPGDPGNTSGPPENCHPREPEEFELTTLLIQMPNKQWLDITALVIEEVISGEHIEDLARAALETAGAFDQPDAPEPESNYRD
jgi:hypothetical protein